mmetsp:Transcript_33449/g.66598  ORF Transcript_33449/g.66598 Transcript_33449/m.66598 type:complete len:548 (-) Transcript_33449:304-1947(-)
MIFRSRFLMSSLTASSIALPTERIRVAVIGGGVGACSFVNELSKQRGPRCLDVEIFEMGRGVGGRASTRLSRDVPGLAVNHGAPYFEVTSAKTASVCEELVTLGALAEWDASSIGGHIHSSTGAFEAFSEPPLTNPPPAGVAGSGGSGASSGVGDQVKEKTRFFAGNPGINMLSKELLKGATQRVAETSDDEDATVLASVHLTTGTMVRGITHVKPGASSSARKWELRGRDGEVLAGAAEGADEAGGGESAVGFDWLVVTGNGLVHPRWTAAFGGLPPLAAAAADAESGPQSASLDAAISTIAAMGAAPVTAAMMAWSLPAPQQCSPAPSEHAAAADTAAAVSSQGALSAIHDLPFRVLYLGGDGDGSLPSSSILARVVVAPFGKDGASGGEGVSLVLHSTTAFAESASGVYGATSTAARLAGASSDVGKEQAIVAELVAECRRVFKAAGWDAAAAALPSPVPNPNEHDGAMWGPHLHRWGNAFPSGAPLPADLALCEDARVLFCGDFVEPRSEGTSVATPGRVGSVEGALLSGMQAAEALAAVLQR